MRAGPAPAGCHCSGPHGSDESDSDARPSPSPARGPPPLAGRRAPRAAATPGRSGGPALRARGRGQGGPKQRARPGPGPDRAGRRPGNPPLPPPPAPRPPRTASFPPGWSRDRRCGCAVPGGGGGWGRDRRRDRRCLAAPWSLSRDRRAALCGRLLCCRADSWRILRL